MDKPFQRKGAESNTRVGNDFESMVRGYFQSSGLSLNPNYSVQIGIIDKKAHKFDFGNDQQKVIIECKAHRWTEGGNVPSAKMTTWNQAMYYFFVVTSGYQKILCVLKDYSQKKGETLGEYYLRTNYHLIPKDVEIMEFDEKSGAVIRLK